MKPGASNSSPIARHVASIARSGIRDFFDLVHGQPDVISLGVGEPDFVTPWNIREAAIYSLEKGHTSYTSNLGLPRFCLLYTSPSPRDATLSRMPSSA